MEIKIGMQVHELTVLKEFGEKKLSSRIRPTYWVRCSCGEEFEAVGIYISRGDTRQCQACSKRNRRKYRIGETFDQLTIVKRVRAGSRVKVLCRCSCGGEKLIRPSLLSTNQRNHCGCLPASHWQGYEDLSKTYYMQVTRNARKRGFEFDLTMECLFELFREQDGKCAISGVEITLGSRTTQTASLDRIDSTKNYDIDNVQWTHKTVNRMKMDTPQEEFLEWCSKIHRANASSNTD